VTAAAKTLRKIPATVVTGFLGSGKTTLLRHLLENAGGLRIAVIVNEFGEAGVDGEILRECALRCGAEGGGDDDRIYELANGCLCCTVQEEFFPVMRALAARRGSVDHILIETSGLALPKPLVQAFNWPEIAAACTVDAVIAVVDSPAAAAGQFAANPKAVQAQREADENLDHESPLHELFEDQLQAADLVVLNKSDEVDAAQLQRLRRQLSAELPPQVRLITAAHGRVAPHLLLGLGLASERGIEARPSHHDALPEDHDHDEFGAVTVELGAVELEELLAGVRAVCAAHTVYRVKGFADLPGKAMRLVVHGVGGRLRHYFDRPWAAGERRTQLVFIGDAGLSEAGVRRQLDGFVVGSRAA